MQDITPGQQNAESIINENQRAVLPASLYGRRAPATTGLTWAFWGGQFNGVAVANGTVALTASSTNYVVAHRTTGVVTAATNTTNWSNTATYLPLYSMIVGASTVTSYVDFRQAFGVAGGGGGGGAVDSVNGQTGTVVLALGDLNDVNAPTPDDGDVLTWDDATSTWVPAPPSGGGGGGDVSGPASSVDNTLPRFNGTTGKTIQGSGVVLTDDDELSGYKANVNQQTGTTYTLVAADSGKIVELANAAAIALTAPNNLPKGFNCTIVQGGAGQVTVASSGSGSVVNRQSQFKTAGQNAMCSIYVRSNSGTNAVYVFGGDTAA